VDGVDLIVLDETVAASGRANLLVEDEPADRLDVREVDDPVCPVGDGNATTRDADHIHVATGVHYVALVVGFLEERRERGYCRVHCVVTRLDGKFFGGGLLDRDGERVA